MPNNKNITLGQLRDFAEKADVRLDALESTAAEHQAAIDELTERLGNTVSSGELDAFLAEVVGGG